jgi:predicted ATPase/lambda repressor-like predicted transcriptional regulator
MAQGDHLRHVRELADEAGTVREQSARAAVLAELQRESAWALREVVAEMRDAGVSWRELAADLGIATATLHGQYNAGQGVLVAGQGGRRPSLTTSRTAETSPSAPAASLTRFVGRTRELADLRPSFLRDRLVTLTGPGGVGKTRLAAEFVRLVRSSYPGGVWWVELAPLTISSAVSNAVSAAVRGDRQPGRPASEMIAEACAGGPGLLVLDNCEHVVDQCADVVAALLVACPRLRVLTTSREALRIGGESLLPVAPLAVPGRGEDGIDHVRHLPAVQLFADRARNVVPGFAVTRENAAPIAEICRELDGLPLAIELAASRVRLLGVHQVRSMLKDRFALLDDGPRSSPDRHRSLHAAIAWSYQLLPPVEQAAFRRLAVLAGGFGLAGATAVCADGLDITPSTVLNLLSRLQAKSLIAGVGSERGPRFRQFESVRIYAWDQLVEAGELRACQERMIGWLYGFVRAYLHGEDPDMADPWLHIGIELDNLQLATPWAEQRGDDRYVGLATLLAELGRIHGNVAEARELYGRALETDLGPAIDRAYALSFSAAVEQEQANHEEAIRLASTSLALARSLDNPAAIPDALDILSAASLSLGRLAESRAYAEEHVALSRREYGPWWTAIALVELAHCLVVAGDLDEAAARLVEAEPILRARGELPRLSRFLHVAGQLAFRRGDIDGAETAFAEAVTLYATDLKQLGYKRSVYALEGLALVADRHDQHDRALRLAAAAAALRDTTKTRLRQPWQADVEDAIVRSRTRAVDPTGAWVEGSGWTVDEAVAYALGSRPYAPRAVAPLTAREFRVAELVAEGFTNQQVAARLGVSPRTIANHLHNIRKKLDLATRAHVIAWVTRQSASPVG